MVNAFKYDALDPAKDQIRLLKFRPGCDQSNTVLELEIQTTSLPDFDDGLQAFHHVAVSYFWGDASSMTGIKVDGGDLKVPPNTVKALRSLHRYLTHPAQYQTESERTRRSEVEVESTTQAPKVAGTLLGRLRKSTDPPKSQRSSPGMAAGTAGTTPLFWIDAVCIDQNNHDERAQQVALMRRIYEEASEVFVWLGDPSPTLSWAAVKEVHSIFEDSLQRFDGNEFPPARLYGRPSPNNTGFDWHAIKPLYQSPWFGRLWTIQETTVARKAICAFGVSDIPLHEVLMAAYSLARTHYVRPPAELEGISEELEIAACRLSMKGLRTRYSTPLLEIMRLVQDYSATDPRDMIYGMLGLHGRFGESVRADYNVPTNEVFARATMQCIDELRSLQPLQSATARLGREKSDLPSWVLRFVRSQDRITNLLPLRVQFPFHHQLLVREGLLDVAASTGWKKLRLSGALCDEITAVVTLLVIPSMNLAFVGKLVEVLNAVGESKGSFQFAGTESEGMQKFAANTKSIACTLAAAIYASNPDHVSDNINTLQGLLYDAADYGHTTDVDSKEDALKNFEKTLVMATFARKKIERVFFVTKEGRMGMGPPATVPGDQVAVFLGGPVPFVLRQKEDEWTLLGDAYVHDLGKEDRWQNVVSLSDDERRDGAEKPGLRQTFDIV